MRDQDKTKEQLIDELKGFRQRIAELEKAGAKHMQAEEALKESEKRFRELVELLPEMVFETDTKGNVTFINTAAIDATGYSNEDFEEGIRSSRLTIPEDRKRFKEMFAKRIMGEDIGINEYMLQRKDGTRFPVIVHSNVVTDDEGNVVGTRAIAMDITERKKEEDALRESEERYRAIFEQAADSIVLVDANTGILVEFNDRAHENLGYTREEFEKLKIPDFEIIETPQEVTKHIEKIIKEGFDTFKTKHRSKGGEIRDILVNSKAISIGGKDFVQSIWMDITERKLAEEKIRDSEEKFREIFRGVSDGLVYLDRKGIILEVNEKAVEIYGGLEEELIGKHFTKVGVFSLKNIPKLMKIFKSILTGKAANIDISIKNIQGQEMYLECSGSLRRNGRLPTGLIVVVRDVTERKRTEDALRESEEKYRDLIEKAGLAVMIDDKEGKFSYFNEKCLELLGYSAGEMKKQSVKTITHPEDVERVMKLHNDRFQGKKVPSRFEFKGVRKDGSVIYLDVNVVALKKGESIIGTRSYIWDITDRKKAEGEREKLQAQLVQSEKMAGIGTLTSGIAHEFNNLLQIMGGHVEYAQRTKKPEDMEEALDVVGNTTERVSEIIKDLLTFSRRDVLERKLSSIPELIDFVISMTEEQMKKNNITVVREYGRVPKIEVNTGEMQQVFLNLVTNARDAMLPKGGKLEIRIKKVKDNVEISFTDTGIGIEKENSERVFEPFYTTKGAVGGDTRIQGIGLGLSVSYGIVQRHGGTIEVESEAGKETTFTIRLPAKVEKAKKRIVKAKSKPKAEKTKPRNVLVVDDEEEICKMFTKWLSAEGHKVKSALTGEKALNLVKKESFDIVFLDIVMPGILAIDTLVEMKEISPKTKIIMITGKLVDKDLWKGLKEKGASGYLQKPFKIENIRDCIAKTKD